MDSHVCPYILPTLYFPSLVEGEKGCSSCPSPPAFAGAGSNPLPGGEGTKGEPFTLEAFGVCCLEGVNPGANSVGAANYGYGAGECGEA